MKQKGVLIAALTLLAVGIVGLVVMSILGLNTSPTTTSSTQSSQNGSTSSSSIGQQIFLTGVGSNGRPLVRNVVRGGGSTMATQNGCASCHGTTGVGGRNLRMMGSAIDVPDITYSALKDEGFTDAAIGRAIRDGVDEKGGSLNSVMPRWQISDTDLKYLITYLKELSAR